MRKLNFISCLFVILIIFNQCSTSSKLIESTTPTSYTIIESYTEKLDIKDGDIVAYKIEIKNDTKSPIKINGVRSNCGCLIPEWNNKAIQKNKKSEIILNFYSKSKGIKEGNELTYDVYIAINGKEELVKIKAKVFLK